MDGTGQLNGWCFSSKSVRPANSCTS